MRLRLLRQRLHREHPRAPVVQTVHHRLTLQNHREVFMNELENDFKDEQDEEFGSEGEIDY